jgi:L-aspartate oxidase
MQVKTEQTVLIIGGGGAACRAAIEAADAGARVIMLLKGKLGASGATAYKVAEMAGFNVADGQVDPDDTPEEHYKDIMTAAHGMADPKLARLVAEEAPLALKTLEDWGVRFERDGDNYLEFLSCFASRPRTHVIKGHGEPIIQALIPQLKKRNITVYEECLVTNLFIQDGECIGAGFIDQGGEYKAIAAGAVILATGGAGQLFARNLNPPDICGDGYTLGYEAGAELINMEFMQAGIGIIHPVVNILNGWVWSAHPLLTNKYGEQFLSNYLPEGIKAEEVMDTHSHHFPFSSSDISRYIEVAIQTEIAEGRGTDQGGVNLDFTRLNDDYLKALPPDSAFCKMWNITREYLLSRGVDVLREPVQIACFGHAINGGLRINEQGQTSVPGLYAAGEVAGGPHGADRLGGNMMVTCQVFGARAGRSAAMVALGKKTAEIPASLIGREKARLQERIGRSVDVSGLKKRLQTSAQNRLLVRRSEAGLEQFMNTIAEVRDEIFSAPTAPYLSRDVWELLSLLCAGEIMACAALARRESRGSHFRTDFPERDDVRFGSPSVITRGTGKPELSVLQFK